MHELMQRRGSKLDRMRELEASFGHPTRAYRKIHVAGTNGKGSVTTKIASALTQLGYKTGLYTSPHIVSFHERIKIDGKMISVEEASFFLSKILEISREATFFEVITMLAFLYFQSKNVDFAVIETGLGGTLDPTNVIAPELSVITSISYDHMNVLGNTLEEIAENKAGIIKPNTGVVLSFRAALAPVFKKAFQERAPMYILPKTHDWMEENTEIAKKAISILFPMAEPLDFSALPPCRFEIVEKEGLPIVFDIAHNIDGLEKLFTKLEETFPTRPVFAIFGMSHDKDIKTIAPFLKSKAQEIYPFDIDNPRIMRRRDLADVLETEWEDLNAFLECAKRENGVVVVAGSAYIMKDVKEAVFPLLQPLLQSQDLEKCGEFR